MTLLIEFCLFIEHNTDRDGALVEHRQDPIAKSEYQSRLEDGEPLEEGDDDSGATSSTTAASGIRFWSDYSRVYLHPRTLQRLPDLADWEASDGDWNTSQEAFRQHEAVSRECIMSYSGPSY